MSEFDVPITEMSNSSPTNEPLGDLFSGDSVSGSIELNDMLSDLRSGFERRSDVHAQGALREFLNVADLPTTTAAPRVAARRKKMLAGLVATTTGKILLGTAVAAASVGGAHAADIIDVPGLENKPAVVEIEGDLAEQVDDLDLADLSEDHVVDSETDVADADVNAPKADDDQAGDDADDDAGEASENDTHGQTVSDFVHSTDLEGCEKGQAVSALASSKAADHRKNAVDTESADKCKEEVATGEVDTDDAEDVDADVSENKPKKANDKADKAERKAERPNSPAKQQDSANVKADETAKGKPDSAATPGKSSR